ncbi:MAG TPA: tetratricopeptide repeat protein [bacterium]|nr:tetratricopeptide repeat protein [bacterium]
MRIKKTYILWMLLPLLFSGCAYYNTFYNAQKFYNLASKERKKRTRTQIVELSPEEKQQMKKQGLSTESETDRAGTTEMQNYQKAIEKASSLLEFYPKSRWVDDALILCGECFYYRREYSKAQRKFEEIIQLYPNSEFIPKARLYLAKNYIGLQEFDKAEAMFREMTVNKSLKKSLREEARYELAGLYYEKGAYEMAADAYRVAAKESDERLMSAMSLYRLGECLIYLKQPEEAVGVFKRAVGESPNEDFKSQATFKLGESQSMIGDYASAVRTFSNLLSKELEVKRIPAIKLQLANNLMLQGQEEAALKWYDDIIKEHARTDASAKSYFALAQHQEYKIGDLEKAREYYELVRGEFANSIVAPKAKERSDHIKAAMDLVDAINEMLGIKTAKDSLKGKEGEEADKREVRDDAPINLSSDGMWVNYSGRDRPPPKSLADLTEQDRLRAQAAKSMAADSLSAKGAAQEAKEDTLSAEEKAKRELKDKNRKLAEKQLALGELLMFHFDKPDSAMRLFTRVCELKVDSAMSARAFYSIGYIFKFVKKDTATADSVFRSIIQLFPGSPHAEGARKELGIPLLADRIDSAAVAFVQAEQAVFKQNEVKKGLALYDHLIRSWPASPFAEKALYAKGWVFENMLFQYDDALDIYKRLITEHPKSPYAEKLTAKLSAHEKALAAFKAAADSARQAAAGATADSLHGGAASDTLTAADSARVDSMGANHPAPSDINAAASESATAMPGFTPAMNRPDSSAALQNAALDEAEQQARKRAASSRTRLPQKRIIE